MKAIALLLVVGCITHVTLIPENRDPTRQAALAVMVEVRCLGIVDPWWDVGAPMGGEIHIGSGTIVDSRRVLTAAHVVGCMGTTNVHVSLESGQRLRAHVVTRDVTRDLALLELSSAGDFGPIPPPKVSSQGTGDEACVVAASPRRERKCGRVDEMFMGGAILTVPGRPGRSGSGVYDAFGHLVGVEVQRCLDGTCSATTDIGGPILLRMYGM